MGCWTWDGEGWGGGGCGGLCGGLHAVGWDGIWYVGSGEGVETVGSRVQLWGRLRGQIVGRMRDLCKSGSHAPAPGEPPSGSASVKSAAGREW